MSKKIKLPSEKETTFEQLFIIFLTSKKAENLSDATLKKYEENLLAFKKYFDTSKPINELSKKDFDSMANRMRDAKLKHNTIATRLRVLRTFLNWCNEESWNVPVPPNMPEKETVMEVYTDEELEKLLKRPEKGCSFTEFRNWTIINFFLNSGCRAGTIRNIQNRDVDLRARSVVFRHTKTGKIQVIPLCSQMVSILVQYMEYRKGDPEDYLFCDQYGNQLSSNALRLAIERYNKSRGVPKTGLHKFRHTFARKYLVDCGGDAFTLQKIMGHSTLAMTKHYCRLFDTDLAENYDQLSPLAQMQRSKEKIKKLGK